MLFWDLECYVPSVGIFKFLSVDCFCKLVQSLKLYLLAELPVYAIYVHKDVHNVWGFGHNSVHYVNY